MSLVFSSDTRLFHTVVDERKQNLHSRQNLPRMSIWRPNGQLWAILCATKMSKSQKYFFHKMDTFQTNSAFSVRSPFREFIKLPKLL